MNDVDTTHPVNGYVTRNGKFVRGYIRRNPLSYYEEDEVYTSSSSSSQKQPMMPSSSSSSQFTHHHHPQLQYRKY